MANSDSSLLTAIIQMHLWSEQEAKDWHRRCAWSGAIALGLFLLAAFSGVKEPHLFPGGGGDSPPGGCPRRWS